MDIFELLGTFIRNNAVLFFTLLTILTIGSAYNSYSIIKVTNKKIDKLAGKPVEMLVKPLDIATHNIIMENLKGMIVLYTMVNVKNNIVAKQNESMNYIVNIDSIEAKELKEEIVNSIYTDLPEHLISYLEYYFGNTFLQVYIESEIVQAILEEAKHLPKI